MRTLLVVVVAAVAATSAGVARADWGTRDFRVDSVSARLGAPADSSIVLSGRISRDARAAGLTARVTFTYAGSYRCRALDGSGTEHRVAFSGGSRTSDLVKTDARVARATWTIRFAFAIPSTALLCPADFAADRVVLHGATVAAWAGGVVGGPPPGIPVRVFELGAGGRG